LIRLLDRVQIFIGVSKAIFQCGSYGMLLGDENVWSVELEYRLNRVIILDATVGSR